LPLPLPLPPDQAGSETLAQQLRAAAQDKHLAAIILHVDSPGGSALASDLIWREVAHLSGIKPVVVYMSNSAASGGYYVSAPAKAIFAQPNTITGSIGIWGGKIVTQGLYEKIDAHREVVSRGKAAGLYADAAPFSDAQRARIRADIGAGYARFKARVAEGRGMTEEEVEAVARGRVWTGEQALKRGLVDELGDLQATADRARELAGLDPRRYTPLVDVLPSKRYQLPLAAPTEAGEWLAGLTSLLREGVFALAPWRISIRD
jgi:protease-4